MAVFDIGRGSEYQELQEPEMASSFECASSKAITSHWYVPLSDVFLLKEHSFTV